jgi:hypothetical protein
VHAHASVLVFDRAVSGKLDKNTISLLVKTRNVCATSICLSNISICTLKQVVH